MGIAETMETGEEPETGQEMAVVLHEVSQLLQVHCLLQFCTNSEIALESMLKFMYLSSVSHITYYTHYIPHTTYHILHTIYLTIQDKKYYPTAEEVYGPEVEVRDSTCTTYSVTMNKIT